nr:acyl-CoA dehydrogenase family protein [Acinetobacter variabilis]
MLLNDEQKMIQEMMRNYSQQKLKPTAGLRDKTAQFPAQELKELGELGALGMTVSEQWGGAGLDYVSLVLALEEIAAGGSHLDHCQCTKFTALRDYPALWYRGTKAEIPDQTGDR